MTLNSAQTMNSLAIRPSRKPSVILVFLIELCGLFVYNYTMRLLEKSQVETRILAMQARIDDAKTEQYELLAMRDGLNQPEYIDQVAREKFGLAKPGDKVLVILNEPSAAPVAQQVAAASADVASVDIRTLPIWQQWVVFFTTETLSLSVP